MNSFLIGKKENYVEIKYGTFGLKSSENCHENKLLTGTNLPPTHTTSYKRN